MTKRLSLVQIDVFSAKPLEGNALAVVLNGNGLTEHQMQAFASSRLRRSFLSPDTPLSAPHSFYAREQEPPKLNSI
jgi:NADPH-dependent ferric siderophore reductase